MLVNYLVSFQTSAERSSRYEDANGIFMWEAKGQTLHGVEMVVYQVEENRKINFAFTSYDFFDS